jgi:hypothetical protein
MAHAPAFVGRKMPTAVATRPAGGPVERMTTDTDETDRTDGQIRTIESEVCEEMTIYRQGDAEDGAWLKGEGVEVQR